MADNITSGGFTVATTDNAGVHTPKHLEDATQRTALLAAMAATHARPADIDRIPWRVLGPYLRADSVLAPVARTLSGAAVWLMPPPSALTASVPPR